MLLCYRGFGEWVESYFISSHSCFLEQSSDVWLRGGMMILKMTSCDDCLFFHRHYPHLFSINPLWMDGVSSNLLKMRSIPIPPLYGCLLWKYPYLTAALYIPQWHIAMSKNNLTFKGLTFDNIEKIQTCLKMIPGDLFNDLYSGRIEYPQPRTLKATEILWRHLA